MGFTWVQSGGASAGVASSVAATFAGAVTAGDLIVVLTGCYQGTIGSVSVSDNYGNTYTNAAHASLSVNTGVNEVLDIWYSVITTGGAANTFQVTLTPTVADLINIAIAEFSIGGGSVTVDDSASGSGVSASPATSTLAIDGTDLVVGSAAWALPSGNPGTAGSGFTSIFENNAQPSLLSIGFIAEYQTGVTTNIPATFGLGHSLGWAALAAAFDLTGATAEPVLQAIRATSQRKRFSGKATNLGAMSLPFIPQVTFPGLRVTGPRKPRRGFAYVPAIVPPPVIPGVTFPGIKVIGSHASRRGKATVQTFGLAVGPAATVVLLPSSMRVSGLWKKRSGRVFQPWFGYPVIQAPFTRFTPQIARRDHKPRGGRSWIPYNPGPYVPNFTPLHSVVPVRRQGDNKARSRPGLAHRFVPIAITAQGEVWYHVYSNRGSGYIDYSEPVATIEGELTWTSAPLTYPATWSYGVRAFWSGSGLEEQNVDAVATIVLSQAGSNISNLPFAPTGLRAFALAGGAIRVEWAYVASVVARKPTGFHVYLLTPCGPLAPVTPMRRQSHSRNTSARPNSQQKATLAIGGGFLVDGRQQWTPAIGGGYLYGSPIATTLYSSGFVNAFVSNLAGLQNGVQYAIGVRAYNAIGEETNTNFVLVTADSVGPTAVTSLTATATT